MRISFCTLSRIFLHCQWSAGGFSGCLNLALPKAFHAKSISDHARLFQCRGCGPDASSLAMRLELLALLLHLDGVDELLVANLMANDDQSHADEGRKDEKHSGNSSDQFLQRLAII